jgi:hypothetical protein
MCDALLFYSGNAGASVMLCFRVPVVRFYSGNAGASVMLSFIKMTAVMLGYM